MLLYLRRIIQKFEIVVVDDGSTDSTCDVVLSLTESNPEVRLIRSGQNRGKGNAVKEGILDVQGKYILMSDADLSTPIEELEHFLPLLDQGSAVVIGTRKHKHAHILRHQPVWRESMGKCFTWISNMILGLRVTDFTCGFKAFRSDAAKHIFSNLSIDRWAFDSELLFLAHRFGYPLAEVPVKWANSPETKVRIVRDTVVSLLSLFQIRLNAIRGKYVDSAPRR